MEVFGFVLNKILCWEATFGKAKAVILKCNSVKEFLFIIITLCKEGVFVLQGMLNDSHVDESELVTSAITLICCGLWEEHLCLFEACG